MPEDTAGAGSATDGASQDAQPQGQATGGNAPAGDAQGGTGTHSAAPGDDRSAEAMLADAVGSGDGADGSGGDDVAAQLKKAQDAYAKLQRQSRTWETRAKENADKAKAHDAYVESQKTEAQKQADALAAAQEEARTERTARRRLLAAANYDLPPSMIDHLAGSTEDEINTSAEQLAAAINERAAVLAAAQDKANGQGQPRNGAQSTRPVESLRPGALPASDNKPQDPNAWLRATLAAKKP
jgi:hypothetical protein